MKNLSLTILFLLSFFINVRIVEAQQYVEKQESTVINIHKNAGYENGKGTWLFSNPENVQVITGGLALRGSASLRFESTAASQTVKSSQLTVPPVLRGGKCQSQVSYLTFENGNKYLYRALSSSGTVLASKELQPSIVMGVPVEIPLTETLDILNCPSVIQTEVISTGAADKIDLDDNHTGSVVQIRSEDIVDELGYQPVESVTASGGVVATGDSTHVVVSLNPSGVISGAYTKVTVDQYGRVTSGTNLAESDIPNLDASKIASGTLPVVRGGTGVNSYSNGDILIASGSTLVKKAIGSQGQVLTVNPLTGLPDWMVSSGGGDSGVNLNKNDFELDVTTGWVTSGVTVARQAFNNGTTSDAYYASMTATVSGAYFETDSLVIPDNLKPGNLEFGGQYANVSGTWRADWYVSGTVIASQTLTTTSNWTDLAKVSQGISASQTITKARFTKLTSGTATLGVNKIYLGSNKSIFTGPIVGPLRDAGAMTISATTSAPGKGSIVVDKVEWRQDGDFIEAIYTYQHSAGGTAGSGDYLFSLPAGFTFGSSVVPFSGSLVTAERQAASALVGNGTLNSASAGPVKLFAYDSTRFRVMVMGLYTSYGPMGGGNFPLNNQPNMGFRFVVRAPISQFVATGSFVNGECPNATSCTNEFTVQLSSAGTKVSNSENVPWVASTSKSGGSWGNHYNVTFNTGLTTGIMNCKPIAVNNGTAATPQIVNVSTNSITYAFHQSGTGDIAVENFLSCTRTSDFKVRHTLQASFSSTMNHSGDSLKREAWASFGGAGSITSPTVCNATPCTKYKGDSAITGSTRSGTGTYSVNVAAGTFNDIDIVKVDAIETAGAAACYGVAVNVTTMTVVCRNTTTGNPLDWAFAIEIKGRQ